MKHKFLKYCVLIFVIITLFLIHPKFKQKYLEAEKNVLIFNQEHRADFDSLVREYEINSELVYFKNDSAENVLNQKYTILKHEAKMQKLTEVISEDEYQRKYREIAELEIYEKSTVSDSFIQRIIRLDYPTETKVPPYLSKKVTTYNGINGIIGVIKWVILVISILIFFEDYFKLKKSRKATIITHKQSPGIANDKVQLAQQDKMVRNGRTLVRMPEEGRIIEKGFETENGFDAEKGFETWIDEDLGQGVEVPLEEVQAWEQEKNNSLHKPEL